MKQITLIAPAIHCPSCTKIIKMSLEELPGVIQANVDLSAKTIVFSYDETIVDTDKILSLLSEIGYPSQPLV
jgi:copper chaperone CopZ